jgi:methylated-DNA-protein-cysteine methyltransferase-like protein
MTTDSGERNLRRTGVAMPPTDERSYYERIYKVVEQIPRGLVTTYGNVATIVGDGCDAQIVGRALGALDDRFLKVPWQRVVSANGKPPMGSMQQRDRLEAEGVAFNERGCVLMDRFAWAGPSEEWAQTHGFQVLPQQEMEKKDPDSQLSLF